ncbi:MAG TPA: DUF2076 domain-containing protein [Bosea sp. (in: a-proteobacteria)]|uniref:DUF2076 domain-containing protein n=1 Tax=Bosea sp. (in: a-proteobacteria) TaxID=1871050 RepID=UPI002E0DE810|nr:DUF2076 domain-containing protein [Bosea sp. (in: a-proteobacteria)]
MTPQERDVIAGIFDRLKQAANQPRDPEAENYIAQRLREQPYAPYAMAQAVYVQETALTNLQAQVEDLQAQLRELQSRPTEAPAQAGGFLSGIFGGGAQPTPRAGSVPSFPPRSQDAPSAAWTRQQPGAMAAAPAQQPGPATQQPGPWSNQPAQQPPGRGGGFMASALTTAAGVAGGMMLGSVLTNAFGGGAAKAAEAKPAADTNAGAPAQDNGAGAQPAAYDDGSSNEANYQQAAHEEPVDEGYDDGSSMFDGGDDDSWT